MLSMIKFLILYVYIYIYTYKMFEFYLLFNLIHLILLCHINININNFLPYHVFIFDNSIEVNLRLFTLSSKIIIWNFANL